MFCLICLLPGLLTPLLRNRANHLYLSPCTLVSPAASINSLEHHTLYRMVLYLVHGFPALILRLIDCCQAPLSLNR